MEAPELAGRIILALYFAVLACVTLFGFVSGEHAYTPTMLIAHELALLGLLGSFMIRPPNRP